MAGGRGTRLSLGEKPLVLIEGNPILSYVISTCIESDFEFLIITSSSVPYTRNWCRTHNIEELCAPGAGYIPDLQWAVHELELTDAFISLVCDNPYISPSHLQTLYLSLQRESVETCSMWVPVRHYEAMSRNSPYCEEFQKQKICPTGHNILTGKFIDREQIEFRCIIDDPCLTFSVNTQDDLNFIRSHEGEPGFKLREIHV